MKRKFRIGLAWQGTVKPWRESRYCVQLWVFALFFVALWGNPGSSAWSDDALKKTVRKGPVEATVQLEPEQPRVGDPVHLTLSVVGEEKVELIMPIFGQVMERLTIVDYVSSERIDDKGRTVATQRYELQAPRSGKQSIPPIVIEFVDRRNGAQAAPEGLDSYELLTERLPFEVQSVLPAETGQELNPPLGKLKRRALSWISLWAGVVGGLLVAVGAFWVVRVWWLSKQHARRRTAYEAAMGRLMELVSRPRKEQAEIDTFFVELSAIVRWYLENRFDLRAPELTTEEFLESMSRSPDLSGEHQAMLREFLHRADLVKFANFVPSEQDTDESVAAARRFLDETRQQEGEPEAFPAAETLGETARV
jgi:hypothetical protein